MLAFGSGAAALIYELVWFQILELVIGSTAVSVGVLLASFMGGMCAGSILFPRVVPPSIHPLRFYALIEVGIGAFACLVLWIAPMVGSGAAAAACLLLPTLLMGATLPALARQSDEDSLGWLYAANIAGAVLGCLLAGFYLLRVYDVTAATYVGLGINVALASGALLTAPLRSRLRSEPRALASGQAAPAAVYFVIALSGFCALAAEAVWTRLLGLLFGASVYAFSIILAVFLTGLGIGSGIGTVLCRIVESPRTALGWCQWLAAGAIAWTAYNLAGSLPYWPINPAIPTDIRSHFALDLARGFWAMLPATILWGASFPLALAAAGSKEKDSGRLMAGIYAANTFGAIMGALAVSLLLVGWVGSERAQQLLIVLSILAGLFLLRSVRWLAVAAGALLFCVPPVPGLLIAYGRYAATWMGKSEILYAREGFDSSVAVARFPNGALTFHVAGKIQASNVPRDMRLQRMLGHLTTLAAPNPRSVLVIGCGAGITAGAVSLDPKVERETIVEIERLVPQAAAAYFSEPNFNVLHNPRV
ncbi:MAG TPA: fused MFS/spermidine synthase, partial [Bryobacteraceae bacterium]